MNSLNCFSDWLAPHAIRLHDQEKAAKENATKCNTKIR